jgi:hypothetical protein
VDVEEDTSGRTVLIASMAAFAWVDSPASRKSASRVSSNRSV